MQTRKQQQQKRRQQQGGSTVSYGFNTENTSDFAGSYAPVQENPSEC